MAVDCYFDADSVLRRVHRERVVALSAPRALLMMAAHPVAFEGFFMATGAGSDPYARLRRTAQVLDTIIWGQRADADRMTAAVRKQHADAHGTLPRDAGRYPAGTPWRADDPELLLWILACLIDSGLLVYERYVGHLNAAARDRYVAEYGIVGRLFGIPDGLLPADAAALDTYMTSMLSGDDLTVTPLARAIGRDVVLNPPVSARRQPLVELINAITITLLPSRIRNEYRLHNYALRTIAVRGGAIYVKRVLLPLLPSRIRVKDSS